MDEAVKTDVQKDAMGDCATQLSSAAQALERVMGKLEAQYEALNQKIDRIIATVERQAEEEKAEVAAGVEDPARLAKENREMRVRMARKTLPATVGRLLAKSGMAEGVQIEASMLDRALGGLTIEQRMAVKAELARAGTIA